MTFTYALFYSSVRTEIHMASLLIEKNAFSIRKFCLVSTIIDYKFRKCLNCLPKSSANKETTIKSRNINDWIGEDGRAETEDSEAYLDEKKLAYQINWNTGDRKFAFFDFLMYGYRFSCEVGLIHHSDIQTYACDKTSSIVCSVNDDSYPEEEYPEGVASAQEAQDVLDDYYSLNNESELLSALQKNGKLVTFKKNSSFRGQNILSNLIARQNGYRMRGEDMITILDELIPGVVDYEIGHGINLWN